MIFTNLFFVWTAYAIEMISQRSLILKFGNKNFKFSAHTDVVHNLILLEYRPQKCRDPKQTVGQVGWVTMCPLMGLYGTFVCKPNFGRHDRLFVGTPTEPTWNVTRSPVEVVSLITRVLSCKQKGDWKHTLWSQVTVKILHLMVLWE